LSYVVVIFVFGLVVAVDFDDVGCGSVLVDNNIDSSIVGVDPPPRLPSVSISLDIVVVSASIVESAAAATIFDWFLSKETFEIWVVVVKRLCSVFRTNTVECRLIFHDKRL
jgi:hypothetical protein